MSRKLFLNIIRDKQINSFRSFIVLFFYRIMNYLFFCKKYKILFFVRLIKDIVFVITGITSQISYKAHLGSNIRLPHCAMGVVISSKAVIYDNQTIFHGVTIGINENKSINNQKIIIKENCYLSAGCKIISCTINENCVIGPNAVVYKDLEKNTLVVNECMYKQHSHRNAYTTFL